MTKKHFPSGPFKISSFLFVFAALSSPAAVWAEAPVDFETLYNAADLSSVTEAAELPDMPKSYAVNYTLKGILTRAEGLPADAGGGQGKAFLHVADGRVFELKLSDSKAKKYDGKSVIVLGKVKESDELSLLKVEEIAEYTPSSEEVVLPKFLAKRRPARLLADDGSVMTISNVRWSTGTILESEFDWATAKIRPDMIKNAYFVKKPFPPEWIAGHSLLLFTFKDGGLTDDKGNKSAGLVISVEAYLTEGQTYSITQGLKNNFFIVWTLATWEDYASRVVQYEKDAPKLILYPFNFGDSQKSALLRESLKQATVNRAGEYYHTVTNSCTNNLVIVINNVLPEEVKEFFTRVKDDADITVNFFKNKYKRPRPFHRDKALEPCLGRIGGPAYPSGHATIARVYALVLSELVPERKKEFLERADRAALHRVIGGVHHPSDVENGKKLAEDIYLELMKSPAFRTGLDSMRSRLLK